MRKWIQIRYKGAYFNENKIPSAQSEINQIIKLQ